MLSKQIRLVTYFMYFTNGICRAGQFCWSGYSKTFIEISILVGAITFRKFFLEVLSGNLFFIFFFRYFKHTSNDKLDINCNFIEYS